MEWLYDAGCQPVRDVNKKQERVLIDAHQLCSRVDEIRYPTLHHKVTLIIEKRGIIISET